MVRFGSPVSEFEPRQMIDLGLRVPALGGVLDQQHRPAVFHRLNRELERASVLRLEDESMDLGAREAGVQVLGEAFGLRRHHEADIHRERHQLRWA